jgi:hypothetical protein
MNRFKHILTALYLSAGLLVSCTREPVPPPEPVINHIKIRDLRAMYDHGATSVDTNIYIQGIITLTPEFKNLPAFVAYIQDSTAGICLTVTGTNTFAMNSEVKVFCRELKFTNYNGLLQFGDISIADQSEVVTLTLLHLLRYLQGSTRVNMLPSAMYSSRTPGHFQARRY